MKRIAFLARPLPHPATRYRVMALKPYLEEAHLNYNFFPFPRSGWSWIRLLPQLKPYSLLVIQKKRIPLWVAKILKRRGCYLLYDIDDAVMYPSPRHGNVFFPSLRMRRFKKFVTHVDHIMAGSHYLQRLIEPFHSKISILPTSIDLSRYPLPAGSKQNGFPLQGNITSRSPLPQTTPSACGTPPFREGEFPPCRGVSAIANGVFPPQEGEGIRDMTLGWIGGRKSLFYLQPYWPLFYHLVQKYDFLRVCVIANGYPPAEPAFLRSHPDRFLFMSWREEEEVQQLQTLDIGLAPLLSDPWSQGKCATKLLQYMALGLATVSSPYGAHQEIIVPGQNGLFAETQEEWKTQLEFLITHSEARIALGREARKTVEEKYSLEKTAQRFIQLILSL